MSDYVSRIIHLDAISLDHEFYTLIKNLLENFFIQLKLEYWSHLYKPEFELILKFVIWKLTIYDNNCSIGQKLLGVKFLNNKSQLKLLFAIEGILPYIHKRISKVFPHPKVEEIQKKSEDLVKILQVINTCAFLYKNKYPSLSHRFLGLEFVPSMRLRPAVGVTFQLREILWHQFSDFLMIVLPLINVHRLRTYFRLWFGTERQKFPDLSAEDGKCCVCREDATLVQRISQCTFCYYCITANRMADPNFSPDCQHCL